MRWWLAFSIATAVPPSLAALDVALDPRVVLDAVALGQSAAGAERVRFHQRYRFEISRPPIDSVDIVTPFRRVAIAAELRARAGDRRFGQREAFAVLAQAPQQVDVHVEITFHPQNALVLVPSYQVVWEYAGGTRLDPLAVEARPRYLPRTADALPVPVDGNNRNGPPVLPGRSAPMLGATVVAHFDGAALKGTGAKRPETLVVEEADGTGLARLDVDLDALR